MRQPLGNPAPIEIGPLDAKIKRGVKVWPVNSGMAKEELYRWLRLERPTDEDLQQGQSSPPGYCYFPRYSEEYFEQITAEQLVTKIVKGHRRHEWQKMRVRSPALPGDGRGAGSERRRPWRIPTVPFRSCSARLRSC